MPLSAEDLARLYAVPPAEFVRERDAAAKRLREAGNAAAAVAIKALRRPPVTVWAINRLAQERPAEIAALIDAGEALEKAQALALAGQAGDALREATRRERECLTRLVSAVEALLTAAGHAESPATRREIQQTLHAAATGDEGVRIQLRTGTLPRALEPPTAFRAPEGLPVPKTVVGDQHSEQARLREAKQTAERLAREAERAAAELGRLEARLAAAKAEVDRLTEEVRRAQKDARDARTRAQKAERELAALTRA